MRRRPTPVGDQPQRTSPTLTADAATATGVDDDDDQRPGKLRAQLAELENLPKIAASVEATAARLDSVDKAMQRFADYETHMERLFNFLYADLEAARANRIFEDLRPLYMDLILLADRLEALAQEEGNTALISARAEVLEVLARRGIEEFRKPGDAFDGECQKAVGTRSTRDNRAAGRVAASLRPGFRLGGDRILRHEEVRVWVQRQD